MGAVCCQDEISAAVSQESLNQQFLLNSSQSRGVKFPFESDTNVDYVVGG